MKFNLKNRPVVYPIPDQCQKLLSWFVGFEKELRERKRKHEEAEKDDPIKYVATIPIKEILGEDE